MGPVGPWYTWVRLESYDPEGPYDPRGEFVLDRGRVQVDGYHPEWEIATNAASALARVPQTQSHLTSPPASGPETASFSTDPARNTLGAFRHRVAALRTIILLWCNTLVV